MAAPTFATALSNVRRLTSSNLAHQSKPAQLLVAIEQTISSQLASSSSSSSSSLTLPHSATAYFASLLQCLERACADEVQGGNEEDIAETENMGQGALIPATLYLLAIVVPETPTQVVLSKVSPLLECILPLYDTALEHPPALRSLLQITTSLLAFAPAGLLSSSPLLKKSWNYLLELNLDPRPKVRHLAQEGVRKVLTTPIPPKLTPGAHPYLPRAREWTMRILQEEASGANGAAASSKKKARFADGEDGEGKKGIWVVQGLRGWVAVWGEDQLSNLCSLLLSLPPTPHLTSQIYSLLALLLTPPPSDSTSAQPTILSNLPTILDSLLASPPDLKSSVADVPSYLSAISSALIKMSRQDTLSLPTYLSKAFGYMFNSVLLSPSASPAVLVAVSESIGSQGIIRYCVSDEMILAAVNYHRSGSDQPGARKKQKTPFLAKLLEALVGAMESNALKMQYLLPILAAVVSRLRLRVTEGNLAQVDTTGQGKTAAEELLLELIRDVGDLRVAKGFDHKEKVDEVVGAAIEVIGVEGVLRALPLNIEPDASGNTPQPGRAHLLPLIRARTTNDSLAYFTTYFRPLSERVFGRKVAAEEAGRGMEAKIWEALVGQIWDCLPGFCEIPRDLQSGLTTPFLSLLSNLLNTQPLLLPSLLKSLSSLVSTTQTLVNSTTAPQELRKQFGVDQESAKRDLAYLLTLAKDMVAVLLNVFSKLPREQRGPVGDVVGLWAGIMSAEDLVATYNTVTTHLSTNLTTTAPVVEGGSPISHTMLDLLIIFVPLLPVTQAKALFNATAGPTMLDHSDATVQKKSYRLLKRLLENRRKEILPDEHVGELVQVIGRSAASVGPGAQRDRLQCIATIVEIIPTDSLHLIPELLSEAVLGTKEVNEKARDAGFDLLVVMGKKMAMGGVVCQPGAVETRATVEEYIMMVGAGLTGTTPHMISASINALSRLLFEYKDDVLDSTISELVNTVTLFLTSKNREIVKSALGFIKVATVALPSGTIEPHLPQLVPALLGWVHDHKNHFKSKTVHIFERMMRKFGYDAILDNAPVGGERKVLEGIKKRKERAKRKKGGEGDDDGEEKEEHKTSSGNAFDDILYNSDSDDSGDEDDADAQNGGRSQQQRGKQAVGKNAQKVARKDRNAGEQQYIRNEGDQPMDLLSRSIAGGVSRINPETANKKRRPGQDAAHFKRDDSGKLIIEESDDEGQNGPSSSGRGRDGREDVEGSAFMAAQRGNHGQSRDAKGNLRFNRNTKRAREEERADGQDRDADMDMGGNDGDGSKPWEADKKLMERRKKRQAMNKLGDEFRAKRAGGDIKRVNGPDPYSYVPIGQATKGKKGSHAPRTNLTNKKKGSSGRR